MARQLRDQGEKVDLLVMLDTPLPRSETLTPPAFTPFSQAALTATMPSAEKLSRPKPGAGSCLPETKKTGLAMPHPIV